MKRRISAFFVLAAVLCLLAGCCVRHSYVNADCFSPRTCEKCGKTQGEPLRHAWQAATCSEARYCRRCGQVDGEPLEHKWTMAICTAPKTCSLCGMTEGVPLGHWYKAWTEVDDETMERSCPKCTNRETAPMDRQVLLQGYLEQTRWTAIFESPAEDVAQGTFLEERLDVFFGDGTDILIRLDGEDFPGQWAVTAFERTKTDDEYWMEVSRRNADALGFGLFKDTAGTRPDILVWSEKGRAVCFLRYTTERAGTWILAQDSKTVERMRKLPGDYLHIWENGTVMLSEGGKGRTGIMYDLAGNEYHRVEGIALDSYFEIEMEDGEVLLLMMLESGDVMLCDPDENITYLAPSPVGYEP